MILLFVCVDYFFNSLYLLDVCTRSYLDSKYSHLVLAMHCFFVTTLSDQTLNELDLVHSWKVSTELLPDTCEERHRDSPRELSQVYGQTKEIRTRDTDTLMEHK